MNANYENGQYGYPIGDEVNGGNATPDGGFEGRCQQFQGGVITSGFSNGIYSKPFSSVTRTADNRLTLLIKNQSKYDFNSAVSKWASLGSVNIRPATGGNELASELTVLDENRSDHSTVGHYTQFKSIEMNSYYLDMPGYGPAFDLNTMIHEMGHALGLMHSCEGNIMLARTTEQTSFGGIDTYSYRQMWG